MNKPRLVVITGISGAGKSETAKCLEDIGYFCIDNLPATLIPKLAELLTETQPGLSKIALVLDIREREMFDVLPGELEALRKMGLTYEMLFLDASDDVLLRRFSQTRRRHPVSGHESVIDGIRRERAKLAPLKEMADWTIDTSDVNVHQLKERVAAHFLAKEGRITLNIRVLSFGYRFGVPADVDLVFDVRFLPNPYYIEGLSELSGEDTPVRHFVLGQDDTKRFLDKTAELLLFLLPKYLAEGKVYLTIGIGCTGGRHRSVVIANELRDALEAKNYDIRIQHRDINR